VENVIERLMETVSKMKADARNIDHESDQRLAEQLRNYSIEGDLLVSSLVYVSLARAQDNLARYLRLAENLLRNKPRDQVMILKMIEGADQQSALIGAGIEQFHILPDWQEATHGN